MALLASLSFSECTVHTPPTPSILELPEWEGASPALPTNRLGLSPVRGKLPEGLMQKKMMKGQFLESFSALIIMDKHVTKYFFIFEMGAGIHFGIQSCDFYHLEQWFSTEGDSASFKHPRKLDNMRRHV